MLRAPLTNAERKKQNLAKVNNCAPLTNAEKKKQNLAKVKNGAPLTKKPRNFLWLKPIERWLFIVQRGGIVKS